MYEVLAHEGSRFELEAREYLFVDVGDVAHDNTEVLSDPHETTFVVTPNALGRTFFHDGVVTKSTGEESRRDVVAPTGVVVLVDGFRPCRGHLHLSTKVECHERVPLPQLLTRVGDRFVSGLPHRRQTHCVRRDERSIFREVRQAQDAWRLEFLAYVISEAGLRVLFLLHLLHPLHARHLFASRTRSGLRCDHKGDATTRDTRVYVSSKLGSGQRGIV